MRKKSEVDIKSVQKCNLIYKKLLKWIIRVYVIGIFGTNMLKLLGCISFQSIIMQDVFYGCSLILGCIFIYEFGGMLETEEEILIGMLLGSVASTFDEKCLFLLLLYILNLIWIEIFMKNNFKIIVSRIVKIIFYCMAVLEIYSICVGVNNYLLENRVSTSFLYGYMDLFFIIFSLLFFVCKDDNLQNNNGEYQDKKHIYIQHTKLCMWCLIIGTVLLVVLSTMYVKGKTAGGENYFFFGKSIDKGYLVYGDEEVERDERLYFVARIEDDINKTGGVIEKPQSYRYIEVNDKVSYQSLMIYTAKFIYLFQYSGVSVITMAVIIIFLILLKIKKKGNDWMY